MRAHEGIFVFKFNTFRGGQVAVEQAAPFPSSCVSTQCVFKNLRCIITEVSGGQVALWPPGKGFKFCGQVAPATRNWGSNSNLEIQNLRFRIVKKPWPGCCSKWQLASSLANQYDRPENVRMSSWLVCGHFTSLSHKVFNFYLTGGLSCSVPAKLHVSTIRYVFWNKKGNWRMQLITWWTRTSTQ